NPHFGVNDAQLAEIKKTLRSGWPVCSGNLWPKATEWDAGDVLHIAPRDGMRDGHSVLLVGYKDDPALPGGGAFIFRNTSRASHDGYMTYEYAKAYMNDAVWIDYEAPATMKPAQSSSHTRQDILGAYGSAPIGRNRRVSSNEQPGWNSENMDMTWL